MLQTTVADGFADLLSNNFGTCDICVWQNDGKLFATVAGDEIAGTGDDIDAASAICFKQLSPRTWP